jgi:molybdate transport system substrate-binding protein
VEDWRDLARPGVRIVAAGDEVPVTRYANQLVDYLADLPGAPGRFEDAVAAKIVSREDNVRAALSKVELGEGDAAIVYATDAAASSAVTAVPFPTEAEVTATYTAVVIAGSDRTAEADRFVDWLTLAPAGDILASHGLQPPPP